MPTQNEGFMFTGWIIMSGRCFRVYNTKVEKINKFWQLLLKDSKFVYLILLLISVGGK